MIFVIVLGLGAAAWILAAAIVTPILPYDRLISDQEQEKAVKKLHGPRR